MEEAPEYPLDFRIWFTDQEEVDAFAEMLNNKGIHWEIEPFEED